MSGFAMQFRNSMKEPVPLDFKEDMKHVYFDVAGFPVNKQLHDLLLDVSVDNLLYDSDTPYTPNIACIAQTGGLEAFSGMSKKEKDAMFTENAVKLVPRLGKILGVSVSGKTVCYKDLPLNAKEKASRNLRKLISKLYSAVFK